MNAELRSIGRIKTPYHTLRECPRNIDAKGPVCDLCIDEELREGLTGLAVGESILVLYWFENVDRNLMLQTRPGSNRKRGVFALRSPNRPNPIGAAVVKIEGFTNGCIQVRGLDCLDGTPLLDIKPELFGERVDNNFK